ncbi:MAG TPA: CocE/NonD family hydrolase [Thermoanaerobaculia bacterium]|nr:CocE/NonD family hydrolase [Thermoanaerobaculia bacterium]
MRRMLLCLAALLLLEMTGNWLAGPMGTMGTLGTPQAALAQPASAPAPSPPPPAPTPQPPPATPSPAPPVPPAPPPQAPPVEPAAGSAAKDAESAAPVDLTWGFKIPLRDGVQLNGTVYRPAGQPAPLPVIFTLTPYIADSYHERAMYFARHGYVFVLVDVRGRGSSGGSFLPFANEGRDGDDVVEFLARQAWSNGKVTMWGGSYAGFDQWSTLKEAPPHLATIVPAASAHAGVDFPFSNGIFYSYDMQWLTFTSGVTPNANLFGDSSYWTQKFLELYRSQAPFNTLDRLVGNPSPVFQTWLAHPTLDDYWLAMSPSPAQFARMEVPILTITGAYDGDQPGALAYYRDFMRHASPAARGRHYLIIGPWDHAGTRTPKLKVGGLEFAAASQLDMNGLHKQWYDWTLKGGSRPEFLKKRVAYYVVGPGAESWKYADDLDAVANERRTLYLGSRGGGAPSVFESGTLAARPQAAGAPPDHYVYDPRDLRPAELEEHPSESYLTDQTAALNLFGAGVVYHGEPFAEATEVSGYVKLSVWLALDVPDTDLAASLYEILPDGGSVLLSSELLRARYRRSLGREELVTPGRIERYDFSAFTWFSRRVSKGSRLRLVLGSPNSIFLQKNYNSGKPVGTESGADARVAHVTIYHDPEHPSALEIPVVR